MKLINLKELIKNEIEDSSILLSKPTLLTEANFNRVKDKIENQKVPFVMITAFRNARSKMKNLQHQKELESIVRTSGFPWTKMPGSGYVEDPEDPSMEPVNVKENSILIWDEPREDIQQSNKDLLNLATGLAQKYGQDSFIYGKVIGAGDDKEIVVRAYNNKGKSIKEPWAGPWQNLSVASADDIYWSTIGSKRAKLTEMLHQYQQMKVRNKTDAMKKQHYLDSIKSALKKVE